MRLMFGRTPMEVTDERPAQQPVSAALFSAAPGNLELRALGLRALGQSLARKRHWIIAPTLLAFVISLAAVNLLTPRYKSESRILIEGRENVLPQSNADRTEELVALEAVAITSQLQLVLSRDIAREVISKNRLAELPEFDPVLGGISPLRWLLAFIGIGRDPFSMTPEERVLDAYYDRLTVYAVDKSRVIVVEFQSRDPELAARVADSIAEGYLAQRQHARQERARSASRWLAGEIESLRKKVAEAEARAEDFRSNSSLFIGANNTVSNQQMGELNTQLNNARAMKADAEAKAGLIREMLQSGKPIEASEVLNSELMRRISERRMIVRGQLAEQSSTLLEKHPRIKELNAHLADLDRQIRDEAANTSRSLENDARIAGARVESLSASLEQLKKQASSVNGEDLQLRALEREAKAQHDLLDSYLAKFSEANTRETIDALAEGRIISRAIVSHAPAFPNKLPIVLVATLATLLMSAGVIAIGELLGGTPSGAVKAFVPPSASGSPAATFPKAVEPAAVDPQSVLHYTTKDAGEAGPEISEIERLAEDLRASGEAARKITVLGTASGEDITLTALTLARLMTRDASVVLVELADSSATISAVSVDVAAPGLAELMQGEATFGQIITRDRISRVHLVNAGHRGFNRSLLQSPRLRLAIDAFQRVYDHVVLDAGTASDLAAELLTTNALAVVVPDASMANDSRRRMCEQLAAAGFSELQMLENPLTAVNAVDHAARVVAA